MLPPASRRRPYPGHATEIVIDIGVVVAGASLGGLEAFRQVLGELGEEFAVPVVIAQHRAAEEGDRLVRILDSFCALRVVEPEDKEPLTPGTVYLAPADYHLLIDGERCALSLEERVLFARPSIDVLFESAADSFGARALSVLMTGSSSDGAAGTLAIKRAGGIAVVEDPACAFSPVASMAALALTSVDYVVPLASIAGTVKMLCRKEDDAK
ncbi:chemotaxis protein CheB [Haliangium ochraceum]|uniref:protein-glutamate methylesterase n=1 Tax=Haliangium ochraceum (strain DSM 14365 / JCM 11303 / SMP-2) TaxID=502025 RepID=D0LG21_HALO1|nr:chemotaxis protein CheB [Haliangium ochraceum]ACY14623.1 CheB methylesterase [Haliangium ochraceum DSM 14365]